jgi:hypothetical protein
VLRAPVRACRPPRNARACRRATPGPGRPGHRRAGGNRPGHVRRSARGGPPIATWSSRPVTADGPMTLWLVPAGTAGIEVAGAFDGFGLRATPSAGRSPRRA